ncbi:O-methyltransferase [Streptomyces olivaceus]|uniref:O-methyltransferase n=1 Tax=Streptomyces olivaceus TaxID=47716 RepID=UPI001884BAAF|nr:O-methyltransferase [Streptomyces olivaceus]
MTQNNNTAVFPEGYARAMFGSRDAVLDDILRRSLSDERMPTIQVDDNAGRFLQLLTAVRSPRHVVEVGTLFGYSTVHIARGLPAGGHITTLEMNSAAADLAAYNLEAAGVRDRVEIFVGDAAEYLATLPTESVGMFFIDADKSSYPTYLRLCFPALEPGGLLVADDAFVHGDFDAEERGGREAATGILTYVRAAARSPRLFSAFVGTRTGMLVSRKDS